MPSLAAPQVSFDFLSIVELLVRRCSVFFRGVSDVLTMTIRRAMVMTGHPLSDGYGDNSYYRRVLTACRPRGLQNIIYCLAQLVEFTAFIYLRIKLPSLPRCAASH